ncbi:hypothetical protein RHMOL_Rhmol13G0233300 [Rhododendron molle]|uniref:Uncharacterized protein n=1 Tax=Rhododendron molle TaxID=49168 RepID=A0ACC0LAV3_RHOML|nr:hypothetical protein RHMOL_Rhmol13G0233300 [Rhododendron molle]
MGRGKKKPNRPLTRNTATDHRGASASGSNPNQEQSKNDQDSSTVSESQAAVTARADGNPPLPQGTVTDHGGAAPRDDNPDQKQSKIDQLELIDAECRAAIAAHEGGNHVEALRLMDETCLRYDSCSHVHANRCQLHALEASRIGASDPALSREHLRSAVESARRAVSLSPSQEEFGTLYAEALYRLSCDIEGFDEVMRDCERGLLVEDPLQHCRDASLSFMVTVFKKKTDSQNCRSESENVKIGKLRTYWNAMSDERKMELIELRIGDLRGYCRSLCKDGLAEMYFLEGLDYAEKNKSWKFWACYYCDEKFQDFESRLDHIEREHDEEIGQDLQMKPFLFAEIDADSGRSEVYDNLLANGTFYRTDMERIVFTGDSSCPWDDRLLRVEVEDASTSACSISDAEVAVPHPPDIDAFTQWLFEVRTTSNAGDIAVGWTLVQDQMKREGMEVPLRFEKEFALIQSLRKKQRELMVQCRSLRVIQIICAHELWKRVQDGKHVRKGYKSLMTKKLEEKYAEEDSTSPTRKSELEAIIGVVKEANKTRHLKDIVSEFEDQEDASIRMAIQMKMEQPLQELCRNEAQITMSSGTLWRLLVIYKQSSLDYRGIMLDLMPNFIQAQLEALVNEEEKQKPDAGVEALFSKVSLDSKENTSKGNTHPHDSFWSI